jgi:rubrerythrin
LGLLIEKRSVTFYQELLRHTGEEAGQKALQELIAEEKKHQEQLSYLLKDLQLDT